MDYISKNHAKFLILYHLIDLVQIPEKAANSLWRRGETNV